MSVYRCDRCGGVLRPREWVYSRFSGARYCPDLQACDRRFAKRRRARKMAAV